MGCIPGTSRNTSSFEPCFLCPPNTKNNGSKTNCNQCLKNDTFCVRSMVTPLDNNPILSSFDQGNPYPESSDSTEFDDILLQNIFKLTTSSLQCLLISPLFWVSCTLVYGFMIFVVMNILKFCFKRKNPRILLKKAFKHLDLIGERQLWLGGLFSSAIIVRGIKLCLKDPSDELENGRYYVQELNFCQFLSSPNQTLAIDSTVAIEMTKIINRTTSMTNNNGPSFTGLWMPTLTTHLYSEDDELLRYMNLQMTLVVDISESKFYMKNTQEPITRPYDITFNTILFFMLCLELFGLLFLVSKLAIVPLIQLLQRRFFRRSKNTKIPTELAQLVDNYLFEKRVEAAIKNLKKQRNKPNTDSEETDISQVHIQ